MALKTMDVGPSDCLETQRDGEIAEEWRVVAKYRAEELDSGAVETVSADAVRAAARYLLRRKLEIDTNLAAY